MANKTEHGTCYSFEHRLGHDGCPRHRTQGCPRMETSQDAGTGGAKGWVCKIADIDG